MQHLVAIPNDMAANEFKSKLTEESKKWTNSTHDFNLIQRIDIKANQIMVYMEKKTNLHLYTASQFHRKSCQPSSSSWATIAFY